MSVTPGDLRSVRVFGHVNMYIVINPKSPDDFTRFVIYSLTRHRYYMWHVEDIMYDVLISPGRKS